MKDFFYAYFGHHKCATQTISSIVKLVCFDLTFDLASFHNLEKVNLDLNSFLKSSRVDFLIYTNANIQYISPIERDFKGFHVIRDPRDILVSAYFSHLHSHPTHDWPALIDHRKALKNLSIHDGLLLEMDFSYNIFNDLFTWNYKTKNILEIKLEDFMVNPYDVFISIFSHLDLIESDISLKNRLDYSLDVLFRKVNRKFLSKALSKTRKIKIPVDRLLYFVYLNQFTKKTNDRKPGEENPMSHYRKGISGDWKNYFNSEHKQIFKEKYGNLLIKTGYENDEDW